MLSTSETEKLHSLLKDFYTVAGIRIAVFDSAFNKLTEYPSTPPGICAIIRADADGEAACRQCDEQAFARAKKMRKAHSYVCHAGLTEAITPIQLNGNIVGYAIFAHLMPSENYECTVGRICASCKKYCADEAALRAAADKLKRYSATEIAAAMRLLEAVACFLQLSSVVNWKNEDLAYGINEYINTHLAERLSCDEICDRFFISRTGLYKLSLKSFGMGIGQYIAYRRTERAKELLADENLSVAGIAAAVGIPDYNYFCKVFRRQTGTSPARFRRQSLQKGDG